MIKYNRVHGDVCFHIKFKIQKTDVLTSDNDKNV